MKRTSGRTKKIARIILLGVGILIAGTSASAVSISPAANISLKQSIDGVSPQYDWNNNVTPSLVSGKTSLSLAAITGANKTLNQAMSWLNAQRGISIDIDGAYGAQCVDLTMAYSNYLFGVRTYGNGADYSYLNFTGFTRLSRAQTNPQAGDIAVWTGGYGHVGVVISSSGTNFTTLEQNVSGNTTVQQYSRNTGTIGGLTFWGVQRPTFAQSVNVPVVPVVTIPSDPNAVYRFAFSNGHHFFTSNQAEAQIVANSGAVYEGIPFRTATSGEVVYRLYNLSSGEHLYTADKNEYDYLLGKGWKGEGIGWMSPNTGINVYRLRSPKGDHLLTSSQAEIKVLIASGWVNEGVSFKG
ncbi:MAG: CHAP domain-containing protein [Streptococcaceae bacterium]|jgi:hypothetical protein|nr:CHAP domain-containing protein [Streptococcaceae bacterium]